jgi:hypothetical protein
VFTREVSDETVYNEVAFNYLNICYDSIKYSRFYSVLNIMNVSKDYTDFVFFLNVNCIDRLYSYFGYDETNSQFYLKQHYIESFKNKKFAIFNYKTNINDQTTQITGIQTIDVDGTKLDEWINTEIELLISDDTTPFNVRHLFGAVSWRIFGYYIKS